MMFSYSAAAAFIVSKADGFAVGKKLAVIYDALSEISSPPFSTNGGEWRFKSLFLDQYYYIADLALIVL